MTDASLPVHHVLIIGAGISGLLLAQGLKQAGMRFSIFETEPSATAERPREWTMAVHWALPMIDELLPEDLRKRVLTTQPDPEYVVNMDDKTKFFHGVTGELLTELPSLGARRLRRRALRELCSEGIDIQYGKTLSDIVYTDTGVVAQFTDGTEAQGSLIVGTDGPRSKTRALLVGEAAAEVSSSGKILCSATSSYTASQAEYLREQVPFMRPALHPNGSFYVIFPQDVSDPNPEAWTFQVMHSSMPYDFVGDNAARMKLFKERATLVAEPWKSCIEWLPDSTRVYFDNQVYWKSIPFDTRAGRATLAGDAAHPMTPQRGQGFNHAVCDVYNLVAELKKMHTEGLSLEGAVDAYTGEMVKRGGDEVEAALLNTQMVHDWDRAMQSPLFTKSWTRQN
ncbi:hypothetical protein BP6252_00067 [Coleophoma cylindrospora]|uniref:FAD-binding domain-containing protein n=1 Tax=Coleophoma cylindrospora TaxID=1849047 RepID=A0A3D8SNY6_9HELO|nr:hypothetical protein BP6252_00067 [Coleophoma cylindrospora]